MAEGSARDTFKAYARELLPFGSSGNEIIRTAQELGIGIRRGDALGVLRELRAEPGATQLPAYIPPIQQFYATEPGFRYGELVQSTNEWTRFDADHTIMFQSTGASPDDWLDFVIVPDDEATIGQRLIIEDEEYVDPDRPGSGYRTSQPLPSDLSPAEAAARLGVDPSRVARVIFDKQ